MVQSKLADRDLNAFPPSIFYTLCGATIRSSKCQRAEVSFTHIWREKKGKRKNECWMLFGCEVLTRKRPPTHSFGKLSLPLNAAPLFLCIKKCTEGERRRGESGRQAPWEGEENLKWIFRMQAVGWLVWCEWSGGEGTWVMTVFPGCSRGEESQRKSQPWFLLS